jgi:hypothetical protein
MLALTGRVEAVLPLIERLMQWNYGRTPLNRHELVLHPRWDALRGDPAFEALVETAPVAEEWDGDVPAGSVVLVDRIRQAPRPGDAGIPAVESVCNGRADPASQPSDSGGGRASMAAPIRPGLARAPSPPGSRAR